MRSLETKRMLMRQWQDEDLPDFAMLNADPDVMEYYPSTLSTEESNALAQKFAALIEQKGWGFWALENRNDASFMGFVGLHEPSYTLPVTPCVEIGWRLAKGFWGKGYATEAAQAALDFAFRQLNLGEVYSFTSVVNKRSQAVMQRLHMVNTDNNFEHPMLSQCDFLKEHVLYKIDQQRWFGFQTT